MKNVYQTAISKGALPILYFLLIALITITGQAQRVSFYNDLEREQQYYDSLLTIYGHDNMKGTGYKQFQRWFSYWAPKLIPDKDYDDYLTEMMDYSRNYHYIPSRTGKDIGWISAGPNDTPAIGTDAKGTGQIHYIYKQPHDPTGNTLFAASPVGGLFLSYDNGDNWTNAGTDKGLPRCGVSSVVVDSDNPDTWYVTTGNGEAFAWHMIWQNSIGVWRTSNAGSTWEFIGLDSINGWVIHNMRKVIEVPSTSDTRLFVATTGGLFYTENARELTPQWNRLIAGDFYDVEKDLIESGIIYATGSNNTGVYIIDLDDYSFDTILSPDTLPDNDSKVSRISIEISKAAPDYLYAVYSMKYGNSTYLYRYHIPSGSWVYKGKLVSDFNGYARKMGWTLRDTLINNKLGIFGQDAYNTHIYYDDFSNNEFNTTDYNRIHDTGEEPHYDFHYLTVDQNVIWSGNDGGVNSGVFVDDTTIYWESKNTGLGVTTIEQMDVTSDGLFITSGQFDCGSNTYNYTELNGWEVTNLMGGDGYQSIVQDDQNYYLSAQQGSIEKTINTTTHERLFMGKFPYRNDTCELTGDTIPYSIWNTYYNSRNDTLFAIGEKEVMMLPKNESVWYEWSSFSDPNHYPEMGCAKSRTWRIAVDNSNTMYVSTLGGIAAEHSHHHVYKSNGGGPGPGVWVKLANQPDTAWINALEIAGPSNKVYVAMSNNIYLVDATDPTDPDWNNLRYNLYDDFDVNTIYCIERTPDHLWIGTDRGVYMLKHGENSWHDYTGRLPNVEIKDIKVADDADQVFVGTYGRGVWFTSTPGCGNNFEPYIVRDGGSIGPGEDTTVYNDLIVPAGATYSIYGTLFMGANCKIVVEQEAKLIVDGGTITCKCPGMWDGIQVWGVDTIHQFEYTGHPCAQGKLYLKNDARIENAWNAVRLWDGENLNTTGGKVIANKAWFINNRNSIEFMPYRNHHPFSGSETGNLSTIINSDFVVDNNYAVPEDFDAHIIMNGVDGLNIKGCRFENNNIPAKYTGHGIRGYDAGFQVVNYCHSDFQPCPDDSIKRNIFQKLGVAIETSNGPASDNTIIVKDAVFQDNTYGIKLNAVDYATIINSEFNIGINLGGLSPCMNEGDEYITCIKLTGCTGFAIEENEFTKASGSKYDVIGISIAETNASFDEVYRNTFNHLYYANNTEGKNWFLDRIHEGLAFYCNENNGNDADFYVTKGHNYDFAGIQSDQGISSEAAGNIFSQSGNEWHFYNAGDHLVNYFYCESCQNEQPDPSKIVFVDPRTATENTCPSHYGGGGGIGHASPATSKNANELKQLEEDFTTNSIEYNKLMASLNELEDGGNTETLMNAINNTGSANMEELRTELMGYSPFLSLAVLKTIAEKTDVFPENVIFEMLVANPDELRKHELISFLENKEEPLPRYMIDILRELAGNTTEKTFLQQEMSLYNQRKMRAAYDIIRHKLNDTVSDPAGLRMWLNNVDGIQADELIVSSLLQEGKAKEAFEAAQQMKNKYNLRGGELAEYNYYIDLLKLHLRLHEENRDVFTLEKEEKAVVQLLAESSYGTAGIQARSILSHIYGYEYPHCISCEDSSVLKRTIANESFELLYDMSIKVRPNPAKGNVEFIYTLPIEESGGLITIYDISGRLVEALTIHMNKGSKKWDTSKIKPGLYVYRLESKGTARAGKLVIQQ